MNYTINKTLINKNNEYRGKIEKISTSILCNKYNIGNMTEGEYKKHSLLFDILLSQLYNNREEAIRQNKREINNYFKMREKHGE